MCMHQGWVNAREGVFVEEASNAGMAWNGNVQLMCGVGLIMFD